MLKLPNPNPNPNINPSQIKPIFYFLCGKMFLRLKHKMRHLTF